MKKLFLMTLLILGSRAQAKSLVVETTSITPICVYVDGINELCVTAKESKSMPVQERHDMMAVNKQGTATSNFYELDVPEDVETIVVDAKEEEGTISLTTKNPKVKLIEEER
jgi:hypothetical protein